MVRVISADTDVGIDIVNGETVFVKTGVAVTAGGLGASVVREAGSSLELGAHLRLAGQVVGGETNGPAVWLTSAASTVEVLATGAISGGASGAGAGALRNAGSIWGRLSGAEIFGKLAVNTGTIAGGEAGVVIRTANTVLDNAGIIRSELSSGALTSMSIGVRAGAAATMRNSGQISGQNGIRSEAPGSSPATFGLAITNTGQITGSDWAIHLVANTGADTVINAGTITGGTGTGRGAITLGDGNDVLVNGGSIVGAVFTGAGNDSLDLRGGRITGFVDTGTGNDTVTIDDGTTQVGEFSGGGGKDVLISYAHAAQLPGAFEELVLAGPAVIGLGNAGKNRIDGNAMDNLLRGLGNDDTILGGDGDDRLFGGTGNDSIRGGADDDTIQGGDGNDTLEGEGDHDLLLGRAGNDSLAGGTGDDTLDGGAGADTLTGGAGTDLLRGGAGADRFVFLAAADSAPDAPDTIAGFQRGADIIDLAAVSPAVLTFIGTAAFSGVNQVRYDVTTEGVVVEVELSSRSPGPEMVLFLTDVTGVRGPVEPAATDFVL